MFARNKSSPDAYFGGARGTRLVTAITIASSSAFLLLGYDQGVFSGIITAPSFLEQFGYPDSGLQGLVVAIYDLGCLAGAMFCAVYGEALGRRRSAMLGLSIMTVGAVLHTTAYHMAHMIIARIVLGIGNGLNAATIPMYNAEIVKPNWRGRVVSVQGSCIGFGIFLSYWVDYGTMTHLTGEVQWRLPLSLQIVFALVTISMLVFLPESPRWLVAHGRHDEALAVMAALESSEATEQDAEIISRYAEIQAAIEVETAGGPLKWSELWSMGELKNGKRVLLAAGINLMQQLSGCNALVYFIPVLLQESINMDRQMSLIIGGLVGLVFFLASIYPLLFLDKLGRPKPFIVASAVQAISMALVAILLSLDNRIAEKVSVTFFFIYIAIFGTCFLGTPWLYTPELLPIRLRARGSAIATGVNWICNFIIVLITPIAIDKIKWRTYIIFAVLNACWVPLLWAFYPDTSNLTMEQIDDLFRDIPKHEVTASEIKEEERKEWTPSPENWSVGA